MRKILTALIILTMALSINACSNSSDNSKEDVKTETLEEPKDKNQIVLKEVKTSNATKGKKKKL